MLLLFHELGCACYTLKIQIMGKILGHESFPMSGIPTGFVILISVYALKLNLHIQAHHILLWNILKCTYICARNYVDSKDLAWHLLVFHTGSQHSHENIPVLVCDPDNRKSVEHVLFWVCIIWLPNTTLTVWSKFFQMRLKLFQHSIFDFVRTKTRYVNNNECSSWYNRVGDFVLSVWNRRR